MIVRVVVVLAAFLVGCTGSSGSTWAPSGGSGGMPSGGQGGTPSSGGANASGGSAGSQAGSGGSPNTAGSFDLVVTSAEYMLVIGSNAPSSGDRFAVISLTLSNVSVAVPLPTAPVNFSLRTADSLVVLPAPESTLLEPRCREDLAVAGGGLLSCRLAFEVSSAQTPAELIYDDRQGHADTAPVPPVPTSPTACERFEAWLSFDSAACMSCVETSCVDEAAALGTAGCQSEVDCVAACTTGCACFYSCLATPTCRDQYDAVWNCLADTCGAACE